MQRYLETRTFAPTSTSAAADLAQHLLTRQHLGKTVVVCDKPVVLISVVRKYWLRLTRAMQKERASTLNTERILQLTYDITHMQRMDFAARTFREDPRADVFFVTPDKLDNLPPNCFSLYVLEPLNVETLNTLIRQLPTMALVVDYSHCPAMTHAPLLAKDKLDALVPQQWQTVERFFAAHNVDVQNLADHFHDARLVDDTLDTLLGVGSRFMRVAEEFLEVLRLAQPLNISSRLQQQYEIVAMLNRKINALTPDSLSQQFMQSLGDDDTLALHDVALEKYTLALA